MEKKICIIHRSQTEPFPSPILNMLLSVPPWGGQPQLPTCLGENVDIAAYSCSLALLLKLAGECSIFALL